MLNLQKGEGLSLDLNKIGIRKIDVGLGWDTHCDLDAYAILRDTRGEELNTVYYGNKSVKGVRLSGDNLTGAGDGDDEIIYLDISKIDSRVKTISIYVNVYSSARCFGDVKGSYVRLVNPNNQEELAKASLEDKKLDNSKTVHFVDITLGENFDFYVVMEGSTKSPEDMSYNSKSQKPISAPEIVQEVSPRKKKWFGLL